MTVKDELPSFPELINFYQVMCEVAHGTSDDRLWNYHSIAEREYAQELATAKVTRSMWDGMDIIKAVIQSGATIRVLDRSYIDLDTPIGRGFMAMFSALAEDERNRIIKRTHEGRKVSQSRGVKMGRKEKLNELQKSEARRRLAAGELPVDLAPLYGVSRPTIARLRYSKRRG
jgi:DNA invertase Pin-like site-specific DNA recombinase